MQLKSVVLPAPLGPIKPQIAPRSTSKETPSSAVTPPNRIVTPWTASRAEAWSSSSFSAPPTRASASSMDFPFPIIVRPVKPAFSRSVDVSSRIVTWFSCSSGSLNSKPRVADKKHVTADIYSERDRGEERPWSLSRPAGKEIKRPGLERLVADREIVIAARNQERLRPRQYGDELRRVAGNGVTLADRDQRRLGYPRSIRQRQAAACAAD